MTAEPYCPFRTGQAPIGLAKLELQQDLVVEDDFAGSLEAVALVEADWAPLPLAGACPHDLDFGSLAEVLDDEIERCRAIAPPLVAPVDEQLPEVLRKVVVTSDIVTDHHEPDRCLVRVDRPIQG